MTENNEYFRFVQTLAGDLNRNEISLPSFPAVVLRIRAALNDPDTTGKILATILSTDTALASRVLVLANSTYHNPAGIKIESLVAAVGRVGFEQVRSAAITYALEQLYASKKLAPLKKELQEIWVNSLRLAALSEAIARRCTKLDADGAFISGLLNKIGALYIFTKYDEYPGLLRDPAARQSLIDDWSAPVGESIVANWDFSEEIQGTLNPDEVETTRRRVESNLADVVTTAKSMLANNSMEVPDIPEVHRLRFGDEQKPGILEAYTEKLHSLRAALS